MLQRIPYKVFEIYHYLDGYVMIKENRVTVTMNLLQSKIWQAIDGILTVGQVIEKVQADSTGNIDRDQVLQFIESAYSIGIINYLSEEWES